MANLFLILIIFVIVIFDSYWQSLYLNMKLNLRPFPFPFVKKH